MAHAASAKETSKRSSKRSSGSRHSAAISRGRMNVRELFDTPVRQASTLDETAHRPWPVPDRPWVMGQTWDDLLFVHYDVPFEKLRPLVPDGLELQHHAGSGGLAVTPVAGT